MNADKREGETADAETAEAAACNLSLPRRGRETREIGGDCHRGPGGRELRPFLAGPLFFFLTLHKPSEKRASGRGRFQLPWV